jgi:hypothetical protein
MCGKDMTKPEKSHRHRWKEAELGGEYCADCIAGRQIPLEKWNKKYPHRVKGEKR